MSYTSVVWVVIQPHPVWLPLVRNARRDSFVYQYLVLQHPCLTGIPHKWSCGIFVILPGTDINISSHSSSRDLGDALLRGKLDIAFLRAELKTPDLIYKMVTKEPLALILPSDHRLASRKVVAPREIAGEKLLSVSAAPVLRAVIDNCLRKFGIDPKPEYEVDNLAMAMSLIASTRSVALLPAYVRNFLPWSVTSRPLTGDAPTVDLAVGYNRTNTSPVLEIFLSRIDDLISGASTNRGANRN
jgi:LysR family hca operon transcriptional activator